MYITYTHANMSVLIYNTNVNILYACTTKICVSTLTLFYFIFYFFLFYTDENMSTLTFALSARQVGRYDCICVLMLLYMCPHATIYVSSYYYVCVLILLYMCPHTIMCVSSYCYICVLILLYVCPHSAIYVLSTSSITLLYCYTLTNTDALLVHTYKY